MKFKLADIARMVGGDIVAPGNAGGIDICGVARIERAGPGEITFVASSKFVPYLRSTRASAVIVSPELAHEQISSQPRPESRSALVRVDDPYRAFMKLMGAFNGQPGELAPGIDATAFVPLSASVHPEARLEAYVVLGEGVRVGPRTHLRPHVVIGDDTCVGEDCLLHPHVVVRERCWLGDRVIVHAGTVIGADGFGYLPTADGRREKVPQLGRVRIEDDVEIGANTTIDRAMVDETIIRRGAKIDNLVQIGHNCEIGPDTCIAAQAGISGSTCIGARNLIAGQVGFADRASTCDDAIFIAQAGVPKAVTQPGIYGGSPVRERGEMFRSAAAVRRLPDALRRIRELEARLQQLEQRLPQEAAGS